MKGRRRCHCDESSRPFRRSASTVCFITLRRGLEPRRRNRRSVLTASGHSDGLADAFSPPSLFLLTMSSSDVNRSRQICLAQGCEFHRYRNYIVEIQTSQHRTTSKIISSVHLHVDSYRPTFMGPYMYMYLRSCKADRKALHRATQGLSLRISRIGLAITSQTGTRVALALADTSASTWIALEFPAFCCTTHDSPTIRCMPTVSTERSSTPE